MPVSIVFNWYEKTAKSTSTPFSQKAGYFFYSASSILSTDPENGFSLSILPLFFIFLFADGKRLFVRWYSLHVPQLSYREQETLRHGQLYPPLAALSFFFHPSEAFSGLFAKFRKSVCAARQQGGFYPVKTSPVKPCGKLQRLAECRYDLDACLCKLFRLYACD